MKHQIKIGLFSLLLPSLLWAGGSVGNGGGVWACREASGEIRWTKLVDLYEAENEFGLDLAINPAASVEDYLNNVLVKTKTVNRTFYFALKSNLETVKQKIKVVDNANLTVIDDALFRISPLASSCQQGKLAYEQLANYTAYDRILLNKELWQPLSNIEKAGLYLHEAIYLLERTRKNATNSVNTRKLVGLLLSQLSVKVYQNDLDGYDPLLKANDCDVCDKHLPQAGGRFSEGFAAFQGDKGLWGYVNGNGEEVIAPQYYGANPFSQGRAAVQLEKGNWVFIDANNNIIFDTKNWQIPGKFKNGLATVLLKGGSQNSGQYAVINLKGEIVFDATDKYLSVSEGLVLFVNAESKTCEYYDDQKNLVLKLSGYDYCYDFHEGLASVVKNNLRGFVNTKGEVVIAPQFLSTKNFKDGYAVVEVKLKNFSIINKKGELMFAPFQAREAFNFNNVVIGLDYKTSEGYFVPSTILKLDGQQISKTGFVEIPYNDQHLSDFELIPVNYNGLFGYMNLKGEMIIKPQFQQAGYFFEGYAITDKGYILLKDVL